MKRKLVIILLALLGITALQPSFARAASGDCVHEATIASLHHCVEHAAEHGHITSQGISNSLLAKLDAAQRALERGQSKVAVNLLEAVIAEVEAHGGSHVEEPHDAHLIEHARLVVDALRS